MNPICYRPRQVNEFVGCRSKRKFASKELAQRACESHRPYRCQYCGGWHLTSKKVTS